MDRESLYLYVTLGEGLILLPIMYFAQRRIGGWIGTALPIVIIAIAVVIQTRVIAPLFR
jgi:hypothetical protein